MNFRVVFLSLFICLSQLLFAQEKRRPFIDHITVSLSLGSDNFLVDKDKWPALLKNSNRVIPYQLDSLDYEQSVAICGLRLPRINAGFRIQLGKDLFTGSEMRLLKRKFSIVAGIGYSTIRYKNDRLLGGDGFDYQDTNRTYRNESLYFQQSKTFFDFNNTVQYRTNFFDVLEFFIGFGSVMRIELSNQVKEYYTSSESSYNRNLRRFETKSLINTEQRLGLNKQTRLQVFVPFGFTKQVGRSGKLIFEIDYSVSDNLYTDVYKKNEAYLTQLGYSYTFSR